MRELSKQRGFAPSTGSPHRVVATPVSFGRGTPRWGHHYASVTHDLEALVQGAHRTAEWGSAGVSDFEIRTRLGRRTHQGRHAWVGSDPHDPRQRALADASVAPDDGALGGWGAAQLLGVEWLDGTAPAGDPLDGLLCMPFERRVRRPGLRPFRSRLDPSDVVVLESPAGTRVTSPLRTAFDLARTAPSLRQAVAYLDAMARHGVRIDDVLAYAAERPRWYGVSRLRAAAALARGRIRSIPETAWRMSWVLDAGIDAPLVNAAVMTSDGEIVAEADLLDPATGLVGEYDGAPHAGALRRAKDHVRQELLERLGLTLVRCTSVDLPDRRGTGARVRERQRRAASQPTGRWQAVELPIPDLPLHPHSPAP